MLASVVPPVDTSTKFGHDAPQKIPTVTSWPVNGATTLSPCPVCVVIAKQEVPHVLLPRFAVPYPT